MNLNKNVKNVDIKHILEFFTVARGRFGGEESDTDAQPLQVEGRYRVYLYRSRFNEAGDGDDGE